MKKMTKDEYMDLVHSFNSGLHRYDIPTVTEFKDSLSKDGLSFWNWFMRQNNYGGNGNEVFAELEVELGRIPTYYEFVDRVFSMVKTNSWSKRNAIQWNEEKEEAVKLRIGWFYTSHMVEVFTLSQLSAMYPESNIWEDNLVDKVFGVDIVFEDSETGLNYYFHVTKEGNSIQSKENRGSVKGSDGKWYKFKRDFDMNLGHMTLHYSRQRSDTTLYMGSQPIMTKSYLEKQVKSMRVLADLNDFDDSVAPKELSRFQKFVDENNIV